MADRGRSWPAASLAALPRVGISTRRPAQIRVPRFRLSGQSGGIIRGARMSGMPIGPERTASSGFSPMWPCRVPVVAYTAPSCALVTGAGYRFAGAVPVRTVKRERGEDFALSVRFCSAQLGSGSACRVRGPESRQNPFPGCPRNGKQRQHPGRARASRQRGSH